MRDAVDGFLTQWATERPDLDATPMGVIGRLHRAAALLETELRSVFAEAGLGNGDFDVLASLRRSGSPYRLSPSQLGEALMVTGGAITKRVDRLVASGLVQRSVADHDARGRDIALTARGLALVDDLAGRHFANEKRLLSGMSERERTQLAGLLRKLLLNLDA